MSNRYYDNTRIKDHRFCERYFYFRHERHWTGLGIKLPLIFGLAWHDAMDIVWKLCGRDNLTNEQIAYGAHEKFLGTWNREIPEDFLVPEREMRNPETALEMIINYINERRTFIQNVEVLQIEMPFAVPLDPNDPDLFYIGRIDKVVRHNNQILGIEHKTTSAYKKDGGFRDHFILSFTPESQVDGYIHAIHMTFPNENIMGMYIDGALVHLKMHHHFVYIPVDRDVASLSAWQWETMLEIERIEENRDKLENYNSQLGYLRAFPKDTSNCSSYFGKPCPYINICKGFDDPHRIEEVPRGFKEEKWEPFDILGLERLGLEKDA